MKISDKTSMKISGLVLFAGAAQFFLLVLIAEALYPHYSVANNYISDLGVGSTAYIFNTSIVLLGIAIIISAAFLLKFSKPLRIVLILAGIGAMGVGIFPETTGAIHLYSSLLVFFMASIATYFILLRLKNIISLFAIQYTKNDIYLKVGGNMLAWASINNFTFLHTLQLSILRTLKPIKYPDIL